KGDAIGVLVLDEKGKIKADKVGKRSMGKGTVSARPWRWLPRSGSPLASSAVACRAPSTTRTWDSARPIATA
ncbi:MAG: hypothetical protein WBE95_24090, partial [Trebonia sp.]